MAVVFADHMADLGGRKTGLEKGVRISDRDVHKSDQDGRKFGRGEWRIGEWVDEDEGF